MDDRLAGTVAVVVGLALAGAGAVEYVLRAATSPPFEPLTTGVLVVAAGLLLAASGALATRASLDHLALRAATAVGVVTLLLAVLSPESLLFGGVFWLALVGAGLVGAGAYRTAVQVRAEDRRPQE